MPFITPVGVVNKKLQMQLWTEVTIMGSMLYIYQAMENYS